MTIPSEFANHCLLASRDKGPSKKLLGKVTVITFLIDDDESRWTDDAKEDFLTKCREAIGDISNAAKARGVDLQLLMGECCIKLDTVCTNQSQDWVKQVTAQFDHKSIEGWQEYYEDRFDADDAPLIFALNKEFRSFASSADSNFPNWDEYSVVAKSRYGFRKTTVTHELLHQFGAADLYYPQEIKYWAMKYLPDSIMNSGEKIDELTEFLIGWTDTPGPEATKFLRYTANYTLDDLYEANRNQWKQWS